MTDYLTPTTELEAVNEILAVIGEAPVASLTGSLPTDAAMALNRLRTRSRGLQAQGWSFNTDHDYELAVDANNEIPLPNNALSVDAVDDLNIVTRGRKLYDRVKHTYKIGKNIKVDIIRFLPFEELPEYARQFLFISTGRRFQDQLLGDADLHQFTRDDESAAWAAFLNSEAEHGDYNVIRESAPVNRVVRRRGVA